MPIPDSVTPERQKEADDKAESARISNIFDVCNGFLRKQLTCGDLCGFCPQECEEFKKWEKLDNAD